MEHVWKINDSHDFHVVFEMAGKLISVLCEPAGAELNGGGRLRLVGRKKELLRPDWKRAARFLFSNVITLNRFE
jgi:hypothetical protein